MCLTRTLLSKSNHLMALHIRPEKLTCSKLYETLSRSHRDASRNIGIQMSIAGGNFPQTHYHPSSSKQTRSLSSSLFQMPGDQASA